MNYVPALSLQKAKLIDKRVRHCRTKPEPLDAQPVATFCGATLSIHVPIVALACTSWNRFKLRRGTPLILFKDHRCLDTAPYIATCIVRFMVQQDLSSPLSHSDMSQRFKSQSGLFCFIQTKQQVLLKCNEIRALATGLCWTFFDHRLEPDACCLMATCTVPLRLLAHSLNRCA